MAAPRADGRLACADSAAFGALLGAPAAAAPAPTALFQGARYAQTLAGTLSPAECAAVIEATERRGYTQALLNMGGGQEELHTEVRDSCRCIVDSPEFADALFSRLSHALPAKCHGMALVGLNERLRFLRYDAGQKFAVHRDGRFVRPGPGPQAGDTTLITVLLYLNEGYEGCFTTFFEDQGLEGLVPPEGLAVVPRAGLALLHDHALLHSAPPLTQGRKYVLRTDVLYRRRF